MLALVVAGAGWLFWRSAKVNQARAALPRIEELARAERFFEAYDLAVQAQRYLPNDPTLTRLMRTIADDLSVVTDPPGAQVYSNASPLTRRVNFRRGSLSARRRSTINRLRAALTSSLLRRKAMPLLSARCRAACYGWWNVGAFAAHSP